MSSSLINVNKSKQTLKAQWQYLIIRTYFEKLNAARPTFIFISVTTLILVFAFLVTNIDHFMTPKIIFSIVFSLGWIVLLVIFIILFIQRLRYTAAMGTYINTLQAVHLNYNMRFDEDGIQAFTSEGKWTVRWQEFTAFGEHKDSIYILNEQNPIDSIFWSKNEIGQEAYLLLIETLLAKGLEKRF
jgi:hypothetical protein